MCVARSGPGRSTGSYLPSTLPRNVRTFRGSTFSDYQTAYAGQAGHTIAQWHVAEVDAAVRDVQSRGVAFEH